MADEKPSLNDVVAAAYEAEADEPEATSSEEGTEESTTPSDLGAQTEVESKTGTEDSEATAEAEGTEQPDRYFEVDLSGLPAEERLAVIEALKARDDKIGKLLRGEPRETTTEVVEEEAPEELSDAEILSQLGIDPDDPFFSEATAKAVIPLVRAAKTAEARMAAMEQQFELRELESYWTSELNRLEAENGELPVERLAVLEFAATEGIVAPEDAYWRIAGPARRQVEEAVRAAQVRVEAARTKAKKEGSSTRPRASGAESEVATKEARLRDAVKDVGSRVLKDLGID